MTHIVYTLAGDPTPLARPRFGGRYNNVHIYDSQAHTKMVTGITLKNQHGDRAAYVGPLEMICTFYFPMSKPYGKKKHKDNAWHTFVPDLSNLIKFIEDVCQDVGLFKNDSQIARIVAEKRYAANTYTEFYFNELVVL